MFTQSVCCVMGEMIVRDGHKLKGLKHKFNSLNTDTKLKELDQNLSMTEDGALNAGRIPTNATPEISSLSKKQKKDDKLVTLLLRLEQARIWLQRRITQLQEDIDLLLEQRDQATSSLNALVDFHEHYMKTGRFELDENGLPIDPLVRQAIKEWEQETGRQFNIEDEIAPEKIREMMETQTNKIEQLNYNIHQKTEQLDWRIEQLNDLENADLTKSEEQSYAEIQLSSIEKEMQSLETHKPSNSINTNQLEVKLNL